MSAAPARSMWRHASPFDNMKHVAQPRSASVTRSPNRNRLALEQSALRRARALVDHMRTLYRELERRTGAPIAAHRALHCIAAEPGLSPSELAAILGVKRPNLSHLLRLMAERGWIERRRVADDQRSVQLHLLPAGRSLVGATHGRVAGVLQRAIEGLTSVELRGLDHSLNRLQSRLPSLGPVPVAQAPRRGAAVAKPPRRR